MIEIALILFLIILNGVFAMSEIAVVSSRRARLQHLANAGNHKARAALELSHDPGHFLSTIQVGITLIGILSGAIGQAALSQPLSEKLSLFPIIAPYSEALAFALVVASITYLSLIIGELVPKRLALLNPETIAGVVAAPMRLLSLIAFPIVRLLSLSTEGVLRLLGAKASAGTPISEEEIKVLMEQGTQAGIFEKIEQELVRNVFRLSARGVGGIMTPRPDIIYLDLEDPFEENRQKLITGGHSRYPLCKGGEDNILGMVHTKDLLKDCLMGKSINLSAFSRPPLYVPETISSLVLLEKFKAFREHSALVVDEYGEIQGIATLRDVLEAVVGDIPAAMEPLEQLAVQREDGSWLLDGMLDVDRLKEILHVTELPGEEMRNYNTLSGFVMMEMRRVPTVADHFEWNAMRFEIMDMDGNRVDKVLVAPISGQSTATLDTPASEDNDRGSGPTNSG